MDAVIGVVVALVMAWAPVALTLVVPWAMGSRGVTVPRWWFVWAGSTALTWAMFWTYVSLMVSVAIVRGLG